MDDVSDVIAIEPIDLILERLATEGFRPQKIDDSTIRLRCEGRSVWIEYEASDSTYFQVFSADIWELETAEEVQWALEAANHVSSGMKCIKAYVTPDRRNVWIEGAGFYSSAGEFMERMVRIIEIVRVGQTRFGEKMRALKQAASTAALH